MRKSTKAYSKFSQITNAKWQNPFWEADSHSASQEITRLLLNQKVLYSVSKGPTTNPSKVLKMPTFSGKKMLALN